MWAFFFAVLWFLMLNTSHLLSSAVHLHFAGNASFTTHQADSFWYSDAGEYSFWFSSVSREGDRYLLCVWLSADINKTPLWWADPDNDPTVSSGSILNFTSRGVLELRDSKGTLLWSSGNRGDQSAIYAQLQDTRNLVLLRKDAASIVWQSVDSLRDTLMISNLSKSNESSFASGKFYISTDAYLTMYFHSRDTLQHDFIYLYASMTINSGANTSTSSGLEITRDSMPQLRSNSSTIGPQKLTLDYDGNLRIYIWESNKISWKPAQVMLGSPCGPFGVCSEPSGSSSEVDCSCPPGYQSRVKEDLSQGCKPLISFNASCGQNGSSYYTSMQEMDRTDYDYSDLRHEYSIGFK
ncbi:hypothetical protein KP509_37G023000 [Ceratopteris richardii]|uniref:Bulb-type lectin domain-containing protein n=1 Tax=Ceratopteris richardii TaxID=49495 RepID=A0A8T2Q7B7_CERRI|nr:hypothetical protein KP509_37G023000 [Ceratopteris richardii]